MGKEIEAKMKVPDLELVRARLREVNATRIGTEMETNTFYDTPQLKLRQADSGLRIRVAILENAEQRCTITFKGKLQPGSTLKTREEIEFKVSDPQSADELFQRLGYSAMLAFEKRRETWNFAGCEIALDEMPYLGTYVEIEGPSDEAVLSARKSLNLADLPLISRGYISLLAEYLFEHKINERHVRL